MSARLRLAYVGWGLLGLALVCGVGRETSVRGAEDVGDLPRADPASVGMSATRLERINGVIDRAIGDGKVAGAVTLVARRGKVVHHEAQGYLDREAQTPMRRDALFRMASSSKPATGVAVMMLIEEGKVGLTDPVSRYIPEFKDVKVAVANGDAVELVAPARPITVRDLMTHTSGVGSGGLGSRGVPREKLGPGGSGATLAEGAAFYASLPLDFQPGTQWRYSGLAGIDALARVVEVASGQSFERFLRDRLFGPLGMKDTGFTVPEAQRDRLASVHQNVDGKLKPVPSFIRFPETYTSGAGGLNSTAADFFRFAQMLCDAGRAGETRLLSPRGVSLMGSNHVGELFAGQAGRPKGMGFGLTVEIVVDPVTAGTFRSRGSFGWDGAFGTHFWVDPQEQLVAVLLIQTSNRTLHRDFETAVMQAVVD